MPPMHYLILKLCLRVPPLVAIGICDMQLNEVYDEVFEIKLCGSWGNVTDLVQATGASNGESEKSICDY